MRKLKLEVEDLRVESFDTLADMEVPRGTVRGHGDSEGSGCDVSQCLEDSCGCPLTGPTCAILSCNGTCYNSCPNTCGCSYFQDVTCAEGNCP